MTKPTLQIALALIWKDGCLLISRRPHGAHLAGFWEFPGGKCHADEAATACAEREALEEVGVVCRALALRASIQHEYADRRVVLLPVDCAWQSGEPRPLGALDCAWVRPSELARYEFPPANATLLAELVSIK
ncbi:MAG TPA: (deoxy)nucleoside triphosphate pyrophosphohydrolase [Polyangiaceae bacterium]